jgi:hypothetical protein
MGPIVLSEFEGRTLMPIQDIIEFLKPEVEGAEGLSMTYAPSSGNQIFHIGDRSVEVSPMASNDEIKLAFLNPFIRTENTKVTVLPNRLLEKLNKASGVVKRVTDAVEAKADAVIAREQPILDHADKAFAPHMSGLDQADKQLDQVEDALNQMSNGAPE